MFQNSRRAKLRVAVGLVLCSALFSTIANADPFANPGDQQLRHDLSYLSDRGHLEIPLSAWPVSWADIGRSLSTVDALQLSSQESLVYARVLRQFRREQASTGPYVSGYLGVSADSRRIRTFEDTPRSDTEISGTIRWSTPVLAANLSASIAKDGDEVSVRPDGSHASLTVGNWLLSAGWHKQWWGPGHGGSLILSNNARSFPALLLQRKTSTPAESPWFKWLGPWTLSTFMGGLDDSRSVDNTLLFGMRFTARPFPGFEAGFSRTAQWCGSDRPCGFSTFGDLLLGRDNRGVNVSADSEPGNQLAGFDIRWRPSRQLPAALYVQWIGEDSRNGGPLVGSWLRQAGLEVWGGSDAVLHRSYIEVSDTRCRDGGLGFSNVQPDCAYEHRVYRSGYRYRDRPIGHGMDGDGVSYSIGSTLVQSGGQTWTLSIRHMKINSVGVADGRNSLFDTPHRLSDAGISYSRETGIGRLYLGLGHRRAENQQSEVSTSEISGFIRWSLE